MCVIYRPTCGGPGVAGDGRGGIYRRADKRRRGCFKFSLGELENACFLGFIMVSAFSLVPLCAERLRVADGAWHDVRAAPQRRPAAQRADPHAAPRKFFTVGMYVARMRRIFLARFWCAHSWSVSAARSLSARRRCDQRWRHLGDPGRRTFGAARVGRSARTIDARRACLDRHDPIRSWLGCAHEVSRKTR